MERSYSCAYLNAKSERRIAAPMKTNLIINLALFILFLIGMEPALAGNAFHEWLNLTLGTLTLVHLVIHWDWIAAMLRRQFKTMSGTLRINFILNVILFISIVMMILSGLMISRTVIPSSAANAPRHSVWNELHSVFGNILLILIASHIGLHWNWIVNACRRCIIAPLKLQFGSNAPTRMPHKTNLPAEE